MNPLERWISRHGGVPAKAKLREAAGVRWQTIHYIAQGLVVPRTETLTAIERATRALTPTDPVIAFDLLSWFVDHPPPVIAKPERDHRPKKRKRRVARRRANAPDASADHAAE